MKKLLVVGLVIVALVAGYGFYSTHSLGSIIPGDKTQQSLKVLYPNGGESYKAGSTVTLKWSSTLPKDAKLGLSIKDENGTMPERGFISAGEPNSGSYDWEIPDTLPSGTYKLRIQAPYPLTGSDDSDGYFTVSGGHSASSIRILSPNGGESYKIGDTVSIRWTSDSDSDLVGISVYDPAHSASGAEIARSLSVRASGIDGTFSKAWKVSGIPAGTYKVDICKIEYKDCDDSDRTFKITN